MAQQTGDTAAAARTARAAYEEWQQADAAVSRLAEQDGPEAEAEVEAAEEHAHGLWRTWQAADAAHRTARLTDLQQHMSPRTIAGPTTTIDTTEHTAQRAAGDEAGLAAAAEAEADRLPAGRTGRFEHGGQAYLAHRVSADRLLVLTAE